MSQNEKEAWKHFRAIYYCFILYYNIHYIICIQIIFGRYKKDFQIHMINTVSFFIIFIYMLYRMFITTFQQAFLFPSILVSVTACLSITYSKQIILEYWYSLQKHLVKAQSGVFCCDCALLLPSLGLLSNCLPLSVCMAPYTVFILKLFSYRNIHNFYPLPF